MHTPEIDGRPTVQGISIIDFHVHFRMAHDGLTRSLAGGQFEGVAPDGVEIGHVREDETGGSCESNDEAQRKSAAVTARTSENWRRSWDFADPDSPELDSGWEAEADRWIQELGKHSIEFANFVTAGGDSEMESLVARGRGAFSGMAAMKDPFAPGAADALEEAIVTKGLSGLKVFAPLMSERIDSANDAVWRVAARYNVPVIIHFGHCGSAGGIAHNATSTPAWLEGLAKRFPEVPFVIPHFGIQHVQDVLFLMWACPNVAVDTSGSNQWVRYMASKLTLEDLFRRFYETVGPDRIIFGSDSSWFPRGFARRYLVDQLRICWEMGMPAADIQRIFGGNAAALLRLDSWTPADLDLTGPVSNAPNLPRL